MPSLFRDNDRRSWRARWKEQGRIINWNTGTKDKAEAQRRATEELGKRRQQPVARTPGTTIHGARLPSSSAPRPSLAELLSRATATTTPVTTNGVHPPSSPAPAPAAPPPAPAEETSSSKVRHLHEIASKIGVRLIDGALQRACRWAGKEPDEMDDDEEQLIAEGLREVSEELFGKVKLTPWGKVGLGTLAAGAGMYMGGETLSKPHQLPPVAQVEKPEGDGA